MFPQGILCQKWSQGVFLKEFYLLIILFTRIWNAFPCWYYCIQINSTHSTHLIALTPLFCFKAAFKYYKYKDLELHLVPFVRGMLQNLSLYNTSEYTVRSGFFLSKSYSLDPHMKYFSAAFFPLCSLSDWCLVMQKSCQKTQLSLFLFP